MYVGIEKYAMKGTVTLTVFPILIQVFLKQNVSFRGFIFRPLILSASPFDLFKTKINIFLGPFSPKMGREREREQKIGFSGKVLNKSQSMKHLSIKGHKFVFYLVTQKKKDPSLLYKLSSIFRKKANLFISKFTSTAWSEIKYLANKGYCYSGVAMDKQSAFQLIRIFQVIAMHWASCCRIAVVWMGLKALVLSAVALYNANNLVFWCRFLNNLEPWHTVYVMQQ